MIDPNSPINNSPNNILGPPPGFATDKLTPSGGDATKGPSSITLGPQTTNNSSVPLSDPSALTAPTAQQFSGLSNVSKPAQPAPIPSTAPTTGWGSMGTWSKPHGTW
jgi:hypothetical protein